MRNFTRALAVLTMVAAIGLAGCFWGRGGDRGGGEHRGGDEHSDGRGHGGGEHGGEHHDWQRPG